MVASKLGLGINQETEQQEEVSIGDIERRGGLLLRGNPRTGKTTLLLNLILQDIEHGHGLMFIDPHGDAIEDILKRLPCREEDVIFFDPFDKDYAFGLNLFECDRRDRRQVSRTVNYVLHMFAKLFTEKGDLAKEAPTMDETMQHTAELLIDNQEYVIEGKRLGMTMAEIPWIFNYEDARARLTPQLTDDHEQAREFWREYEISKRDEKNEKVASTKRRISKFLSDPFIKHIIGQGTSTIDFRDIIDNKKILLVKLTRDDEQLTNFIGSILIGKLLNTVYADTRPEHMRTDFGLYCDEFQNFATPEFAKLFTETGKWHIMPTVSNQVGSLLEHTIRGAIATAAIKVLYQLTEDDANEFAPELAKKPTPVEPREEEQKAISLNPVEHFKQGRGHTNVRVVDLVTKLITPLFVEIGTYTVPAYFEAERPPKISEQPIPDLLNTINRFLVKAMQGVMLSGSDIGAKKQQLLVADVVYGVSVYRCIALIKQYMQEFFRNSGNVRNLQYAAYMLQLFDYPRIAWLRSGLVSQYPPDQNFIRPKRNAAAPFRDGLVERVETDCIDFYPEYGKEHNLYLSYPTESDMDKALAAFAASFQYGRKFPLEAKNALADVRYFYHLKKMYLQAIQEEHIRQDHEAYYPRLLYYLQVDPYGQQNYEKSLQKILDENCTDRNLIDRRNKAWEQAKQDVAVIQSIIIDWADLAQLLQVEPIKVRTGQQVFVPGIQRTFADMVEEMKHELVNLPRHTAYCKLVQEIQRRQVVGKYKLHPYPLRQADSEIDYQISRDWIIEQTRLQYCKPRTEVEEEIKARKDALIAPLKRQSKAQTGDDTKPALSPAQLQKLQSIQAALGEKDYTLFIGDRLVKVNLIRLLNKGIDAEQTRLAIADWRKAGSPSHFSPFEELIKSLLG